MWQSSLLELYHIVVIEDFPKDLLLHYLVHDSIELEIEDSSDDVGPIAGLLSCRDVLLDLLPVGIGSDRDEEVRLAKPCQWYMVVCDVPVVPLGSCTDSRKLSPAQTK